MVFRLQPIFIGYFLFAVETSNVCIVMDGKRSPLPIGEIPTNLSELPSETHVVNTSFQSILFILFLVSIITTICYIDKIVKVLRCDENDVQKMRQVVVPAVERSKCWSFINALGNCLCLSFFLTNSGRVCSGWYLDRSLKEDMNLSEYLIQRGTFFVVIGFIGILSLMSFLCSGRK